jgi:hypothetical protein
VDNWNQDHKTYRAKVEREYKGLEFIGRAQLPSCAGWTSTGRPHSGTGLWQDVEVIDANNVRKIIRLYF